MLPTLAAALLSQLAGCCRRRSARAHRAARRRTTSTFTFVPATARMSRDSRRVRIEAGPLRILSTSAARARCAADRRPRRCARRCACLRRRRSTAAVRAPRRAGTRSAILSFGGLHRRALPFLPIREAHEHLHVLRMEAFDGCADREVAVATDGRVARRHGDAPDRHGFARQVAAEQQMAAAEAPVRGTGDQQRDEHDERSAGDQPRRAAMRREDTISSGGVRSAIVAASAASSSAAATRAPALRVACRRDTSGCGRARPAAAARKCARRRRVRSRRSGSHSSSDNDSDDQQRRSQRAGDRDRGRELSRCSSQTANAVIARTPPIATAARARIDMRAQAAPQRVQVTFESLTCAHFGASRRIAR